MKICTTAECEKHIHARALCKSHYMRLPDQRLKSNAYQREYRKTEKFKEKLRFKRSTNPEYREMRSQLFRNWYVKNKKSHNKYMKDYIKQNKKKHGLRGYANTVLKDEIYVKYGSKCAECGSTKNLEIHHFNYETKPGKIHAHSIDQVILWCRSCHRKNHRQTLVA